MIKSIFQRLLPFFIVGMLIVLFVVGIILFSYLLILGAIIGLILFAVQWIREKFFIHKKSMTQNPPPTGRTFDHKDH